MALHALLKVTQEAVAVMGLAIMADHTAQAAQAVPTATILAQAGLAVAGPFA